MTLLTAEDGLADTVRPRLDALSADTAKISVLKGIRCDGDSERPFSLRGDMAELEEVIRARQAILVVIDPLNAYLSGVDAHKTAAVRGALAPVAAVAERTGTAIVVVHHLNKSTMSKALYRASGSIDFTAAPRSVIGMARDPEDTGRVLLFPLKLNLGPMPDGLALSIGESGVTWEPEPVKVDPARLFSADENPPSGDGSGGGGADRKRNARPSRWRMRR